MHRFWRLCWAWALISSLLVLVGCQKIFGDFTIDDAAFAPPGTQVGPIRLSTPKDPYTTEWGGQTTFTIVLDYAPTSDVTVALSSNNTNEGTVTPTSVTFTRDDWKAPQVVTITGEDDSAPDRNKKYKIITDPAVSEDKRFSGKNPIDFELVNIDNETAGITVAPRSGLQTNEVGGQDTFTIVLNSRPALDVLVTVTSDTPSEGTVSPENLVFTPVNWMAPQLVTITGVDDDVKDSPAAHPYKVTVSSSSEDQNYASLMPITVDVVNQDNESAGLTIALGNGIDPGDPTRLRTSEFGDAATFTVALNAPPSAEVSIPVSSSADTEGVVSPDVLTFTQFNWNSPQTVTVTGLEDSGTADGDQPYVIVLGVPTGDDEDYKALAATDVRVFNADNDKPGFTLMLVSGIDPQDTTRLVTTEAGSTATFTLALNSRPGDTVTIDLSSSRADQGEVSPKLLTFTVDNWMAPQTVSVTGIGDEIQDGNQLYSVITGVAMSMDLSYAIDPPDVQVSNQDDDSAGVLIALDKNVDPTNQNRLVTDEYGSTATFTVALTSQPEHDVSISFSSNNTKEGRVFPETLVFTRLNYRAPQPVTVTGVNDDIADGNQPFAINVEAAVSDDGYYNQKFASQVQVLNRDDDSAGVIVTPTSGLTTSERGTTASFTIRLQSKPIDNVTIAISSSNSEEGKPNMGGVTFTPLNWNANQTIVVTGQDDDGAQDGSPVYRIILAPAQSNDPNYKNKPDPPDVTLTNMDDDTAGIVVSPTSGLRTKEDGRTATFTVAITSKPVRPDGQATTATVRLVSSRPEEGTVNPAVLNFNATNWRAAQTVTVTGKNDDEIADGPQPYLILTTAQSEDGNYNSINPSDVSVTNDDDDSAGVQIAPLPTATTPLETAEKSAGKATFTVALNSRPSSDVSFTVASLDTSEGRVSPGTLMFTSGNWKTPQTVTVTGQNDDMADGDQQYTVRLGSGTSLDPGYGGKFGQDLPFVNLDDDHPGLDIDAPAVLETSEEDEGTATFTVSLLSQPSVDVRIGVSSSDEKEGTVSPSTLVFTSSNWAASQTVTISGVQDDVADGTQTYQVRLANAQSPGDANYHGKFGTQFAVQNLDDDEPGFIVSADAAPKTTEKGGKSTFTVKLRSKPAGTASVSVGLMSNNKEEGTVSPSSLLFTADDWNEPHTVTVTGIDDKKVDGDVSYQIVFTSISSDNAYKVPPPPLALSNTDDDELGVLVTPTTCATAPGTTATFTIQLNSQPSSDVTISLTSDTPAQGSVSPESVTFSPEAPGGWDMPQTITVTGGTGGSMGMMTPYKIITGNASAPGETTGYDGYVSVADVSCVNSTP